MNKKKARELQESWQKLLERHSKPLERGAKAYGLSRVSGVENFLVTPKPFRRKSILESAPSLEMRGKGETFLKPEDESLREAKEKIKARVGQVYNKGGLQLLTNLDIEEQKEGSHRRRN
jgi:hypothetical protein